jgi:hypothetical protein
LFDALLLGRHAEQLAGRLAIDDGLKRTVQEYNDSAASGGRDAFGAPLQPFRDLYGIKVTALYHTQQRIEGNPDG